jgi:hypothetical protein
MIGSTADLALERTAAIELVRSWMVRFHGMVMA